jgi:hypothetical protein
MDGAGFDPPPIKSKDLLISLRPTRFGRQVASPRFYFLPLKGGGAEGQLANWVFFMIILSGLMPVVAAAVIVNLVARTHAP